MHWLWVPPSTNHTKVANPRTIIPPPQESLVSQREQTLTDFDLELLLATTVEQTNRSVGLGVITSTTIDSAMVTMSQLITAGATDLDTNESSAFIDGIHTGVNQLSKAITTDLASLGQENESCYAAQHTPSATTPLLVSLRSLFPLTPPPHPPSSTTPPSATLAMLKVAGEDSVDVTTNELGLTTLVIDESTLKGGGLSISPPVAYGSSTDDNDGATIDDGDDGASSGAAASFTLPATLLDESRNYTSGKEKSEGVSVHAVHWAKNPFSSQERGAKTQVRGGEG